MVRVFQWIIDHSGICLLVALGLVAALSTGLPRLEVDGSIRALFPDSGEAFEEQRDFSVNFRKEPNVIVVVRAVDIFQPEVLDYMQFLGKEMAEIENVRAIQSLFTTRIARPGPGGIHFEPLVETVPKSREAAEELRREVLATPLSRNILVNKTGQAATIQAALAYKNSSPEFEEAIVNSIRDIIEGASERMPPEVSLVYLTGGPVIATTITSHIWRDMLLLGPIALFLIVILSFLCFRRLIAPLLVLSTGILSVIATLGFMGYAGIAINPIVSVIIILILVVGCTEDIHIISEFLPGIDHQLRRLDALRALANTIVPTLFLTSFSTALGFLTLLTSPVPGLRDFGLACATGIILNFLITLLISPGILRLAKTTGKPQATYTSRRNSHLERFLRALSVHPVAGATVAAVFLIAAGIGITRLEINNDYLRFFSEDSAVRQDHFQLVKDFGGSSSLVVTIETKKRNGVYGRDFLLPIAAFHDRLGEEFPSVFGVTDLLRQFQLHNAAPDTESDLPEREDDLADFRLFFGKTYLKNCVDFDGSKTAIWIRVPSEGSLRINEYMETILQLAEGILPPEAEVKIVGQPVMTAYVSDLITRELVQNLFLLATAVAFTLMLFFRSFRIGILAIIPNIFPVLITFGFMGWAEIPLSTGTFAVALVALGISVDDTIHLFTRYRHERSQDQKAPFPEVLIRVLRLEVLPISVTSLILTIGFLPLLFSDFQVHRETGLLFVVAILSAFAADLFVTPVTLRWYAAPASLRTK